MSNPAKRIVAITGASSGIGFAAARAFLACGDTVYSLSRTAPPDSGIRHIPADVTSDASASAAIQSILAEQGRIDVLILNAGFGISGAAEFTGIADAIRQFDVNFFGAVRCLTPALAAMRKTGGTVIFLSSVAAAIPIPFQAYYSAVKAATSAYVLALRNELKGWPVRVCAVLPGDVKTGFTGARRKNECGADVYPALVKSVATMEHDEQNGMSPDRIAAKLVSLAGKRHPKPLSTVGLTYKLFLLIAKLLPARFVNWLVGLIYA